MDVEEISFCVQPATGYLQPSPASSLQSYLSGHCICVNFSLFVLRDVCFLPTVFRAFTVWCELQQLCSPPTWSYSLTVFRGGRPWGLRRKWHRGDWESNISAFATSEPASSTHRPERSWFWWRGSTRGCMHRWCQTSGPWIQFCTNRHQGAGLGSDYDSVSKNSWGQLLITPFLLMQKLITVTWLQWITCMV